MDFWQRDEEPHDHLEMAQVDRFFYAAKE